MSNAISLFRAPRPVARPRARLLCFPHAGGSATVFHRWPLSLDADVEVLAAELPGRGTRLREAPYRRMPQLVSAVVEAARPFLDVPYLIFGHSFGAAVAFELALALRSIGAPPPVSLVVSGRRAPHLPSTLPPLHPLPRAAFIQALEARYGVANSVLKDPEMAAMLYPPLQADIETLETWTARTGEPLSAPIIACAGSRDPTVTREGLDAWREHTTATFALHMFSGDHFYLLTDPSALLGTLRAELSGVGR